MARDPYGITTGPVSDRSNVDQVMRALRARRFELGLSAQGLADRMGHDVKSIKNWESGRNFPRFRAMKDWCDALGVELTVKEK